MSKIKTQLLYVLFGLVLSVVTLYSYTQIDLNLTLSSNTYYQFLQNLLIRLGYFNRALSVGIFLSLLSVLFAWYIFLLYLIRKKLITASVTIWFIVLSVGLLFFAYPAFSHDIFNYMFDARILTKYHANPYMLKALDFPSDLWIRFMHWTHRTYPYGPIWLLLTAPLSILGMEKFVLTLWLYKLLFALFHLGNIYLLWLILKKTDPENTLSGVAFYAFNPLILIESLVSPHNEVIMLFFLLLAVYFGFIKKKEVYGFISLILSAGIKFITFILLPLFMYRHKSKKVFGLDPFLKLSILLLSLPLIFQIISREPYPWYFILFIGLGALLSRNLHMKLFLVGISVGSLLRYTPFLYSGEYTLNNAFAQNVLFAVPIIASVICMIIIKFFPIKLHINHS